MTRRTLADIRDDAEKLAIARALLSAGSIIRTAQSLGVTYHTLYRRLKRYKMHRMKTDELSDMIKASTEPLAFMKEQAKYNFEPSLEK